MRDIVNSGEIESPGALNESGRKRNKPWAAPAPDVFIRCSAGLRRAQVDSCRRWIASSACHNRPSTTRKWTRGLHTLLSLQQAVKLSDDPVVRYATLVHDVGKGVTDTAKWPSHHATMSSWPAPAGWISASACMCRMNIAKLAALVCEHHTKTAPHYRSCVRRRC